MKPKGAILCLAMLAMLTSVGESLHASEPAERGAYKRIKAPQPGTRPRITIQITPEEHATAPFARSTGTRIIVPEITARADKPSVPGPAAKGKYHDYWSRVSPDLTGAGPGRLFPAIQALSGSGVTAPRLQTMQEIARKRGVDILRSTIGTEVSPALVLAVIAVESAGRADAVSKAGAQGLMQLMPATAKRFGVSDRLSPGQNISGGVKYLDWLMEEFENDPLLVLAGYNAGEGAVRKHSGVPPYAETRDYVPKVLAAFQVARALCATPPELISDGCVFQSLRN